jgi:hypothetical protein
MKVHNIIFQEIRPMRAALDTRGQTDGNDEAQKRFSRLYKRAQNYAGVASNGTPLIRNLMEIG